MNKAGFYEIQNELVDVMNGPKKSIEKKFTEKLNNSDLRKLQSLALDLIVRTFI